ncbi:MAG: patatin-like phospholipase family protein [Hyphomicrobiales bacterium]
MTTRALVLGGGGPVGIAWESGLLAGIAEGGVDLGNADFIIGTSAGSFVGAQLAMGHTARELAEALLARGDRPPAQNREPSGEAGPPPDLTFLMTKMMEAQTSDRPPEEIRREIGQWALQAPTMSEDAFIASFGHLLRDLPEDAWPERRYACTAVDAADGSFQLWTNGSGVGLARAVASSCSVPGVYPPITINGRRYIDGGMRSSTNADQAKGYDVVAVVAVTVGGATPQMAEVSRRRLEAELQVLRDGGSRVELITPSEQSMSAFGPNLMDFRRRQPAAQAGLEQGRGEAARLKEAWA